MKKRPAHGRRTLFPVGSGYGVGVALGLPPARPWLATKLTQSPWFLNRGLVNVRQPPSLH